jgi:hypothetical protein
LICDDIRSVSKLIFYTSGGYLRVSLKGIFLKFKIPIDYSKEEET